MLTLYQFATSPFAEKVRRALNYKRVPYEIHEVVRAAVPEGRYVHVSASGKFPAITHAGHTVQDSTEILEYLDHVFPEPALYPAARRDAALVRALEDWADESLYFYEMTVRLSWAHNLDAALDEFSASMPGVPRDALRANILDAVGKLVSAQGLGRKSHAAVVADLQRHFLALEDMLAGQDWLVGGQLSAADLAVLAQVNALLYARECRELLATCPNVIGWRARADVLAPGAAPVSMSAKEPHA